MNDSKQYIDDWMTEDGNNMTEIIRYVYSQQLIINSICLNDLDNLLNTFGGIGTVSKRFNICNYAILGYHLHSEGNFVKIGVARGDCSKLILENIPNNYNLHLFDTFEGLAKPDEEDEVQLDHEGSLSFSLESVKDFCGEKEKFIFI